MGNSSNHSRENGSINKSTYELATPEFFPEDWFICNKSTSKQNPSLDRMFLAEKAFQRLLFTMKIRKISYNSFIADQKDLGGFLIEDFRWSNYISNKIVNSNGETEEERLINAIQNTLIPEYKNNKSFFHLHIFVFAVTDNSPDKWEDFYSLVLLGFGKVTNFTVLKVVKMLLKFNLITAQNTVYLQLKNLNKPILGLKDLDDVREGMQDLLTYVFNTQSISRKTLVISFIVNKTFSKQLKKFNSEVDLDKNTIKGIYNESSKYFNIFSCRRDLLLDYESNPKFFNTEYGLYEF